MKPIDLEKAAQKLRANTLRSRTGCLLWTGSCNADGYGNLYINGQNVMAHRVAYLVHKGQQSISALIHVMHHCDNPPCCNPKHLYGGTRSDNMRDMHKRGRRAHSQKRLTQEEKALILSDPRDSHELGRAMGRAASTIRNARMRARQTL